MKSCRTLHPTAYLVDIQTAKEWDMLKQYMADAKCKKFAFFSYDPGSKGVLKTNTLTSVYLHAYKFSRPYDLTNCFKYRQKDPKHVECIKLGYISACGCPFQAKTNTYTTICDTMSTSCRKLAIVIPHIDNL